MTVAVEETSGRVAEEDMLRAQLYGLLAKLLMRPADQSLLDLLAGLSSDDSPMGQAFDALQRVASVTSPDQAEAEYNDLFIGVTQGELIPYASHYITGFLNDKPLMKLRGTLADMGVTRAEHIKEPEDHIAFLCETMRGMIVGAYGVPMNLAAQKTFFEEHIAPWAERFFSDLQKAESAKLYGPIGVLGGLFLEIETEAFQMAT